MGFMPFQVLGIWLRGLLSLAILALGIGLLWQWSRDREAVEVIPEERTGTSTTATAVPDRDLAPEADGRDRVAVVRRVRHPWHFGWNLPTAELVGGLALVILSLGGGRLAYPLLRRVGSDEPRAERTGQVRRLRRPDGSELQVEVYGPEDAPTLVLTHGWGADSTEWYYAKTELGKKYRLVVWDQPGLGRSTRPRDNDWSLERLAEHLDAVVGQAGDRPVILVGHSIGGMMMQTYCRLFPEALGRRVAGLVVVHTTYTNPVKTTSKSALLAPLQKPVLEPLCHLMIALAPLVWLMNGLSYLNGTLHRQVDRQTFTGHETRGQLDFAARFQVKAWPAVVARGMLAMFRFDESATHGTIGVPTLVVAADRDKTTTPEASERIAQGVPGASLVTLAPARHMGLIEQHPQFAEAVDRFVTALAPAAAVDGPDGHRPRVSSEG